MLLKDVELRKKISMNALSLAMKFDHKHGKKSAEFLPKNAKRNV